MIGQHEGKQKFGEQPSRVFNLITQTKECSREALNKISMYIWTTIWTYVHAMMYQTKKKDHFSIYTDERNGCKTVLRLKDYKI